MDNLKAKKISHALEFVQGFSLHMAIKIIVPSKMIVQCAYDSGHQCGSGYNKNGNCGLNASSSETEVQAGQRLPGIFGRERVPSALFQIKRLCWNPYMKHSLGLSCPTPPLACHHVRMALEERIC